MFGCWLKHLYRQAEIRSTYEECKRIVPVCYLLRNFAQKDTKSNDVKKKYDSSLK